MIYPKLKNILDVGGSTVSHDISWRELKKWLTDKEILSVEKILRKRTEQLTCKERKQ